MTNGNNDDPDNLDDLFLLQARLTAIIKTQIEEARRSPLGLYKLCCSDDTGGPIIVKDFHEEWDKMFMEYQFTLIEASRGTTKTSFAIFCALWAIGSNQNIRIKWLGPNDENAKKRKRVISTYIEESKLYQRVFPHIKLDPKQPNNAFMLTVARDTQTPEPTVEAKGILSTGVGDRTDLLILDDVADMRNTLINPALRPQVLSKLLGDWLPTLNPKSGKVLDIFTPWHDEDVNSYLKRTTQARRRNKHGEDYPNPWVYKKFAHGRPGDPYFSIFPELFPREKLQALHLEEGDLHYSRGRLCQTLSKDTVAILPEQLVPYSGGVLTMDKLKRAICVLSVDPSSGRTLHKGELDYLGIGVLLFVPRGPTAELWEPPYEIFIPEAYQIKLATKLQVKLIVGQTIQWGPEATLIEAQGMGNLHEWMWEHTELDPRAIIPITVGNTPKGQRLMAVTPFFQLPEDAKPKVYFHPRVIEPNPPPFMVTLLDGSQQQAQRDLRHQILSFPTKHDDILDAITQGLQYIHRFVIPKYVTDEGPRPGQAVTVLTSSKKKPNADEDFKWDEALQEYRWVGPEM